MKMRKIATAAALSIGLVAGLASTSALGATAASAASSSGHGTTAFQQARVNKVMVTWARKWISVGQHPTSDQTARWFDGFSTAIDNTINICYVTNQSDPAACTTRYEPIGNPAAANAITQLDHAAQQVYDSWWASSVADVNYLIKIYDYWMYKAAWYYNTPRWAVNDLR